ncbi:MAG: 2-phospho-L-lactate transferase [Ilumatobacter sp.]|nr:2-phospho-L-lactate transferase [Ilumatobacter sp.]
MRVTVLAGGVGAARFLRGLIQVVPPSDVTAVVNTGDDTVLHGLSISPDLDTVTYTLAEAIDPERGWGLAGETWAAMSALERLASVRPSGSSAAPTWFNLGDRDLATHLYRTARLDEGASLTAVTAEIARAWELSTTILPMTDGSLRTMITLADSGDEVSFQDYFVRLRHARPVASIRFDHAAMPTTSVIEAIEGADAVVVAPSNPLVSIGPIRALPGIDEALSGRRESVVAVSPIVGGAALKGPAARMLTELGREASVVGVARLYAPIAGTLVVDPVDDDLAPAVEAEGQRCVVAPSIMSDLERSAALARTTIDTIAPWR